MLISEETLRRLRNNESTLRDLNLSRNNIGDAGVISLARVLHHNTTLTSLGLGGNDIGDASAINLAILLQHNTTLEDLHLRENHIGPKGAVALATVLQRNTTLKVLSLRDNCIGDDSASDLAATLEHNTTLTCLDLGNNNIGSKGAVALATVLLRNTTLKVLSLIDNCIGDDGASDLAATLEHNTMLTCLDLGNNNIGSKGGKALAKALQKNTTLTWLDLGKNNIGPKGAKALAKALQKNTTLSCLYLDRNNIGSKGAKALAKALQKNTTLEELNLIRGNNIADEGACALVAVLQHNTTLTMLYLHEARNSVGPEHSSSISALRERNRHINRIRQRETDLTAVDLSWYKFNDTSAEALLKAVTENPNIIELTLNWEGVSPEIQDAIEKQLVRNRRFFDRATYGLAEVKVLANTGVNRFLKVEFGKLLPPELRDEVYQYILEDNIAPDEEAQIVKCEALGEQGYILEVIYSDTLNKYFADSRKDAITKGLRAHIERINTIEALYDFFKSFIRQEQVKPCLRLERGFFRRKTHKVGRTNTYKKALRLLKTRGFELLETHRETNTGQIKITQAQNEMFFKTFEMKRARKCSLARVKKVSSLKDYKQMNITIVDNQPLGRTNSMVR